jgi:hypothetical protein
VGRKCRKCKRRAPQLAAHYDHADLFSLTPAADTGRIGIDLPQIVVRRSNFRQARSSSYPGNTSAVPVRVLDGEPQAWARGGGPFVHLRGLLDDSSMNQ